MKFVSFTTVATLLLASCAMADDPLLYSDDYLTVLSCQNILKKKVTLYNTTTDKAGFCNRKAQQAMGSMAICLKQVPRSLCQEYFVDVTCEKYNLTMDEFEASYENATKYVVKNLTGITTKKLFYYPVQLPNATVIASYNSTFGRYKNFNLAHYFGWVLLAYWFVLIFLSSVWRLFTYVAPTTVNSLNGKVSNTYRRYVTMPALGKKKVVTHGRFLKVFEFIIPTRLTSVYLFVFFVLSVVFNCVDFHHDSPNTIWSAKSAEIGRKIADRSGIMVLYLMPPLFLFAGRNNFVQWLCGWSYARFNIIHHWMGRISTILMIVHGIGMTFNGLGIGNGKFTERNAKPYVQWGYVATVAALIMCIHSIALLRKHCYELFVLSHNILGAIVVAGTWIHIANDDLEGYMIAVTAVWVFDKFLRLVRCAWFGVRVAEVQLIADETLRVKVPRPLSWKPGPLHHAFIYFMRPTMFWQSHPFTIVDSALEANVITFYIKVKGGLSHGLYKYLKNQPNQTASIKCCVEGPYGTGQPLQHFSTVTHLSGGNGVPGLYASAVDLAKRGTKQKIKLIWVIRHWKSLEWFYQELKALEGTQVETTVYVTDPASGLDEDFIEKFSSDLNSSSDEKTSDIKEVSAETKNSVTKLINSLSFIEFKEGRPNVDEVVKTDISESEGSIAFVGCGHPAFVDDSRKAVIDNMVEGKRIEFYDTMQIW